MTAALKHRTAPTRGTRTMADKWLDYVTAHTATDWRPTEWNPETQIFTGDVTNPLTTAWACSTPGCPARSIVKDGPCVRCRTTIAKGRTPTPPAPFQEVLCGDTGVPHCQIPAKSNGLCPHHGPGFQLALRKAPKLLVAKWAEGQEPHPAAGPCVISWCDRQRRSLNSTICKGHGYEYGKSAAPGEAAFVASIGLEPIKLTFADFTVARCAPLMAAEIIYGLQQRDKIGLAVNPFFVRDLITLIESYPDLASVDREALHRKAHQALDNLRPHIEILRDSFEQRDVFAPDFWPAHVLARFPSRKVLRKTSTGCLDWTAIECRWLREAGKLWLRDTLPPAPRSLRA